MQNADLRTAPLPRPRSLLRDAGWLFFFWSNLDVAPQPQDDTRRAWQFYAAQMCIALCIGYALFDLQVALFRQASNGQAVEMFTTLYWVQTGIAPLLSPWVSLLIVRYSCMLFDIRIAPERVLLLVMAGELAYRFTQLIALPFMLARQTLENPLSLVIVAKMTNQPPDTFGYTFWALCSVNLVWAIALVGHGLRQQTHAAVGLALCIATCAMGFSAIAFLVVSTLI